MEGVKYWVMKTREEVIQDGHFEDPEGDLFINEDMYKLWLDIPIEELQNRTDIAAVPKSNLGQVVISVPDKYDDPISELILQESGAFDGYMEKDFGPVKWAVKKEVTQETDPEYFI